VILAIDGASAAMSVALADRNGTAVAASSWSTAQRQSAELLPRVLEVLSGAGRSVGDVGAVAVGTGPGSFTGLRVAMALAKGLAVGRDCLIVGVPSLVAWLEQEPEADAAAARAGAGDAYLLARGQDEVMIVDRDRLAAVVAGRTLVVPVDVAEAFDLPGGRPPAAGPAIASLAASRLEEDPAGDDLHRLEPIYLRAPRGLAEVPEGAVRWL
jgi:tRNA threonylcarbamoyladenosine biosynthesis protein TsaB